MNLIQSIDQLNQLCHISCFQTDYSRKSQAQQVVSQIAKQLTTQLNQFQSLLTGNITPTTLFVLCQYITKILRETDPDSIKAIADLAIGLLSSCYDDKTGNIVRGGIPLQSHVVNSLFHMAGEGMKLICKREALTQVCMFHKYVFTNSFGLKFWKHLTNIFGVVDYQIGFVSFRAMVYYYQDNAIPMAVQSLLPYFIQISNVVRVNELTYLQENLTVSEENVVKTNPDLLKFTEHELFIAKNILDLIQEILNFPYSITYSEYDFDIQYTHTIIYFPDAVGKLIADDQFYQSLFFLTQRFLIEKPNDDFLFSCIDSLKKIILTRINYFQEQDQRKFIKRTLTGLISLMKLPNSYLIQLDIIQLNINAVNNIDLRRFRHYQQFAEWLALLEMHVVSILTNKPLKYHDVDFVNAFSLIQKLNNGFKHQKLNQMRPGFIAMIHRLLSKIIMKLSTSTDSLAIDITIQSIKQIKTASSQFFGQIRKVILYSYENLIQLVYNFQSSVFDKLMDPNQTYFNVQSLTNLTNLLWNLLHGSVITHVFNLQHDTNAFKYFNAIYHHHMEYILGHYQKIGAKLQNHELNLSVMIFIETALLDYSTHVVAIDKNIAPSNVNKVLFMNKKEKKHALRTENFQMETESKLYKLLGKSGEDFAHHYEIYTSLLMKHLESGDTAQISHVLEVLNVCMMKMKWTIKRIHFKKLPIVKSLIKFCLSTTLHSFQSESLMKSRTQLMKLITILAFDDSMDSFRSKIDSVFNNLNKDNMITLMYDIKGMAEQIDTASIYRYFLNKSIPFLLEILNVMTTNHLNNESYLRMTIKLSKKYLNNNLQRMTSSHRSSHVIYKLIGTCIPYWQTIVNYLMNRLEDDSEQYYECSRHIIQCFQFILQGKYVNFHILKDICPSVDQYLTLNIKFINMLMRTSAYHYPNTKKVLLTCSKHIIDDVAQYIFNIQANDYTIQSYSQLFSCCLKVLYQQLNQVITSDNDRISQFTLVCSFMTQFLIFLNQSQLQLQNQVQYSRSIYLKQKLKQDIIQMSVSFFYGYTLLKPKVFRSATDKLALFLGHMIVTYNQSFDELVNKIQERNPKSSVDLLVKFYEACMGEGFREANLAQSLDEWKDAMKRGDDMGVIIMEEKVMKYIN